MAFMPASMCFMRFARLRAHALIVHFMRFVLRTHLWRSGCILFFYHLFPYTNILGAAIDLTLFKMEIKGKL